VFTILIWGEDLSKFDPKPSSWDDKRVCPTGQITSYSLRSLRRRGPQIAVEEAKSKLCSVSTDTKHDE